MSERIGRILDNKYRIVRVLGVGGMGTVYEAEHIVISKHFALKILSLDYVADPDVVKRFFREAKSASKIGHPNIIDIYDVGREDEKTVYIVMELLTGISLADRIYTEKRLAPDTAVAIAVQILSALQAAHEMGIVHRDLKADNVFLAVDTRGRAEVKLLDFGIAKISTVAKTGFGLTQAGEVMGTPSYLSPEQARGANDVDRRTDLWGVGVMLYEMLTGTLPYDGENYNELLNKITLVEPRSMLDVVPELPLELVAIVEKAMQKDRDKRYESATAMLEDMIPFIEHAARNLMSSAVLKTIKGLPVPLETGGHVLPVPSPGDETKRRSDPMAITSGFGSQDPEILGRTSEKRRKRMFRRFAITFGVAIAFGLLWIVGGITPAWLLGDKMEAAVKPGEANSKAKTVGDIATPIAVAPPPTHEKSTTADYFESFAKGSVTPTHIAAPAHIAAGAGDRVIGVAREEPPAADTASKTSNAEKSMPGHRKKKIHWESNPFE